MIGNVVFSVNGPVVTVQNASDFKMLEMVLERLFPPRWVPGSCPIFTMELSVLCRS